MDYRYIKLYEFHQGSKLELLEFLKVAQEQTTETNIYKTSPLQRYLPTVMNYFI